MFISPSYCIHACYILCFVYILLYIYIFAKAFLSGCKLHFVVLVTCAMTIKLNYILFIIILDYKR